ncbi:hypothetical protein BC833DRAFT_584231 [Globomyces pollinis-pini]|nr:hypothetical protein BC833DRAFT_584231 [Globomyces pollinis-pini]
MLLQSNVKRNALEAILKSHDISKDDVIYGSCCSCLPQDKDHNDVRLVFICNDHVLIVNKKVGGPTQQIGFVKIHLVIQSLTKHPQKYFGLHQQINIEWENGPKPLDDGLSKQLPRNITKLRSNINHWQFKDFLKVKMQDSLVRYTLNRKLNTSIPKSVFDQFENLLGTSGTMIRQTPNRLTESKIQNLIPFLNQLSTTLNMYQPAKDQFWCNDFSVQLHEELEHCIEQIQNYHTQPNYRKEPSYEEVLNTIKDHPWIHHRKRASYYWRYKKKPNIYLPISDRLYLQTLAYLDNLLLVFNCALEDLRYKVLFSNDLVFPSVLFDLSITLLDFVVLIQRTSSHIQNAIEINRLLVKSIHILYCTYQTLSLSGNYRMDIHATFTRPVIYDAKGILNYCMKLVQSWFELYKKLISVTPQTLVIVYRAIKLLRIVSDLDSDKFIKHFDLEIKYVFPNIQKWCEDNGASGKLDIESQNLSSLKSLFQ